MVQPVIASHVIKYMCVTANQVEHWGDSCEGHDSAGCQGGHSEGTGIARPSNTWRRQVIHLLA